MQTRKAARVTVTRLFDLVYVFNTRDYSCSVLERGLALLLTLFRLWLLARLTAITTRHEYGFLGKQAGCGLPRFWLGEKPSSRYRT